MTSPLLILSRMFSSDTRPVPAELLLAARVVPVLDQLLGRLLVGDDVEDLARVGHAVEAEHLDRRRRAGLGERLPLVVQHGADLPEYSPATTRSPSFSVPSSTRIVEIGPRARSRRASMTCPLAALFGLALSSSSSACSASISSSLSMPSLVLRRDVHEDRAAAPLLRDQLVLGELVADLIRIGARLVDLVDRDDDRNLRLLGVVDRLDRLRHRPVVGGDDQDDDVGHLGAAGAHGGERLVARRIEEHDVALLAVRPCRRRCAG